MKFKTGEQRTGRITAFNEFLSDIINDINAQDDFIIMTLTESWREIAGSILSVHTRPDRIFKKFLFISCDHSDYSLEIAFMKNSIMSGIEKTIGVGIIKDFRVEVKRLKI